MPLVLGKLDHNLYKLLLPHVASPSTTSCYSSSATSRVISPFYVFPEIQTNVKNVNFVDADKTHVNIDAILNNINKMDVVWHYKLRHIPFSRMKHIYMLGSHLSSKQSFSYTICLLARQTRLSFSDSSIQTTKPFQLIHIDTWGPYHSLTYTGSKYFMTIVDDFSRATWTHLMGAKINAFDLLKASLPWLKLNSN